MSADHADGVPPPDETAEEYIARHGGPDKVFARSTYPQFRSTVPTGPGRGITLEDLKRFIDFDDAHRSERATPTSTTVDEAIVRLSRWTQHDPKCSRNLFAEPCDCGLDAELTILRGDPASPGAGHDVDQ